LTSETAYPDTPDGRYFIVRGRLWRKSDPSLLPQERALLVKRLMAARRAVALARINPSLLVPARLEIDRVKRLIGERGPVWWTDGAPDLNRHLVKNTPYSAWYSSQEDPSD
jgi:hypothetical protein